MKTKRRKLGLLLIVSIIFGLIPYLPVKATTPITPKSYKLVDEESEKNTTYTIDTTGKLYIKITTKGNSQLNLTTTSNKKITVALLNADKENITNSLSSKAQKVSGKTVYGISSVYYVEKSTYYFLITGKASQKVSFRCNYTDISDYKLWIDDNEDRITLKMNSSNKYLIPADYGSTQVICFEFKISQVPDYLYLEAITHGESTVTLGKVGEGVLESYDNHNNVIGNLYGGRDITDYESRFFVDDNGDFTKVSTGTYYMEFERPENSAGAIVSIEFFNYYPY